MPFRRETARPLWRHRPEPQQDRRLPVFQVLRDRRLTHGEGLGQLSYGCFALGESREDRPPCWIG